MTKTIKLYFYEKGSRKYSMWDFDSQSNMIAVFEGKPSSWQGVYMCEGYPDCAAMFAFARTMVHSDNWIRFKVIEGGKK